jgi:hypothetical protein
MEVCWTALTVICSQEPLHTSISSFYCPASVLCSQGAGSGRRVLQVGVGLAPSVLQESMHILGGNCASGLKRVLYEDMHGMV